MDDMGPVPLQCYGSASSKADCYYGKLDSTTTVALVGDSHSAKWLGAAQAADVLSRRWSVDQVPG
ncbi:MAG: hypothetical protein WCP28_01285 [Actinomycetes bacterium]